MNCLTIVRTPYLKNFVGAAALALDPSYFDGDLPSHGCMLLPNLPATGEWCPNTPARAATSTVRPYRDPSLQASEYLTDKILKKLTEVIDIGQAQSYGCRE